MMLEHLITGTICFMAGWCIFGVLLLFVVASKRDRYNDCDVCANESDSLVRWIVWQQAFDLVRKFLP